MKLITYLINSNLSGQKYEKNMRGLVIISNVMSYLEITQNLKMAKFLWKCQWWNLLVLVFCFVILLGWLKSTKFFILLRTPHNFLIPFLASFAKSSKTLLNFFLNFVHLETFFSQGSKTLLSCCSLLRII